MFAKALTSRAFYYLLLAAGSEWLITYGCQRLWRGRMAAARAARGWNPLTWSCAILWAGALSMIPFAFVHRERRGAGHALLALLTGVACTAVIYGVVSLTAWALGWALGVEVTL